MRSDILYTSKVLNNKMHYKDVHKSQDIMMDSTQKWLLSARERNRKFVEQ